MDRREFLKKNGLLVTAGLLAGCSELGGGEERTRDGTTTDLWPTETQGQVCDEIQEQSELCENERVPADVDIEFETVLNVQELGADPDSRDPITDILSEHIADDTLLVFPDGRYRVGFINKLDLTNFGMVSMQGAQPTLVPTGPAEEIGEWLLAIRGENILLNGFDIDFTAQGHGSRIQLIGTAGKLWCKNIHVLGQIESQADAFKFILLDEDAVGVVERVVARDGSPSNGGSSIGIFVGLDHAGELIIKDCEMWHFQGKGIYASNPSERASGAAGGTIHVEGGIYKNNNPANIRIGGGSTVRNVTFINEDTTEGETVSWDTPLPSRRGVTNARSIRVKGDRNGHAIVENCSFYHEIGAGSGVITVTPTGGAVVRNCDITLNGGDIPAVQLKPDRTDLKPTMLENVTISGQKREGSTILVRDRQNAKFENCDIQMPHSDDFHLRLDSSILLEGVTQDTGGKSVVFDGNNQQGIHELRMSRDTVDGTGDYRYVVGDSTTSANDEDVIASGEISGELTGVDEINYRFVGDILELDVDESINVCVFQGSSVGGLRE